MTLLYPKPAILVAIFLPTILMGCKREQPFREFISRYEKEMGSTVEKGDFRFTSLYESPEYILARKIAVGDVLESGVPEYTTQGIRILLHIRLSDFSGGIGDAHKDPLFSSALSGADALADRMKLFQFGLGQYFYLEDGRGRKVNPLTYHFSRNPTANGACSFLFLFPDRIEGEKLDPGKFEAVLRDFGLKTGTIRMKVKRETDLNLKV